MYCIVQNCRSIWKPNSDIRFHSFPNNEGRKKLWLSILPIKSKLYSTAKICSLHFKPKDYNPDRPGHLLTSAVPFYYLIQSCDCGSKVSNTGPSESFVVPTKWESKENPILMSLLSSEKALSSPYEIQLPGCSLFEHVNVDAKEESPLPAKRPCLRDFKVQVKIKSPREVDLEKSIKVLKQKVVRQQQKINDMHTRLSNVREYTSHTEIENKLQGNFANICKAFNRNQNRKILVCSDKLNSNLEATDMEICRFCLVTDVKMYSLKDESIKMCFESFATFNGKSNIEGLPQYICYECKAILFKSYNLIQKSLISQTTLLDIFAESGQITKHLVRKRNRQHLNLVSPLSCHYATPSRLCEYTYDEDLCISNLSNIDDNTHDSSDEISYINDKDEFGKNKEPDAIYLNIDTNVIEKQFDDDYLCDETVKENDDDIESIIEEEHYYTEPTKEDLSETEFMDDSEIQSFNIHSKEHSKKSKIENAKMDIISDTDMQKFFNIVKMSLQEQKEEYEKTVAKQSEKAVDVEYKCDICHKIFFTLAACQSHISCHDLKRGAFECPMCKTRFKTDNMLSSHIHDVHQSKFHCKFCPKSLNNANAARNHLRWHSGHRAACKLCPHRAAHASSLTDHVRRAHAAHTHACTLCGHAFVSQRGLKLHTAAVHHDVDEKSDVSDEVYRCDECDINFKSEGAKRVHILTSQMHVKKEKGADPGLETTCRRCGEDFPSVKLKHAHVRLVHRRGRGDRDGSYPKLCNHCELELPSRWEHWQHIRQRHPTERSSYHAIVTAVCDTCGKGFASATKLRLHELRHSRPTVACPRCPRVFYDKYAVARHLVTHDTTAMRQHRCATCDRAYFNKCHLLRHAKVHLDEALYECCICSKKLKYSASLKLHMRTAHHGINHQRKRNRNKETNVDFSSNNLEFNLLKQ